MNKKNACRFFISMSSKMLMLESRMKITRNESNLENVWELKTILELRRTYSKDRLIKCLFAKILHNSHHIFLKLASKLEENKFRCLLIK